VAELVAKLRAALKKPWVNFLVVSVGVVLALAVAAGVIRSNWSQFQTFSWQLRPLPLAGAAVALTVSFGLNTLTWHFISHTFGCDAGFWTDVEIYSFSAVIRRLPGLVWQVVGRTYLYKKVNMDLAVPLWGSVWEVFVQFASGVLLTNAVLASSPALRTLFPGGVWWGVLLLPVAWLVARPRTLASAASALLPGADQKLPLRSRQIIGWIALYGASWVLGGAILFLVACAYSPQSWTLVWVCVGLVAASGVLALLVAPIPGGLGIREASLMLLMRPYVGAPVAIASALTFRLLLLVGEMVIALLVFGAVQSAGHFARTGPNTP